MKLNGLIFLLLIGICRSQVDRDWSLDQMCKYHNGMFTKRADQQVAGTGDTCVDLKIQYAVETDTMAWRLCEEMFPYHVTKATLDIDADVDSLYGRCYRMEKKLMKYQDAKDHCQSWDGATIGFIHRNILPVHWKDYYTGVSKMWVQASTVIHDDLNYNTGDHMMLVLNGWHYGVKSFSLIRVDGNVDKAMVLCEYTPQMTREESNYLLRRYSEIYHPGFTTKDRVFIRSASYLIANDQSRGYPHQYCSNVMTPFVSQNDINKIQSAIDDKSFLAELKLAKNQGITYYRSHVWSEFDRSERDLLTCNKVDRWQVDTRVVVKINFGCDGATFSYSVNMLKPKYVVTNFPDARSAPVYCEAIFNVPTYGDCATGYTPYDRFGGVKWCHKYFADEKTATDADAVCQREGGHLTGFENRLEYDVLIGLMRASPSYKSSGTNYAWIGAERREACRWGSNGAGSKGWRDGDEECSRELVFQWKHGVTHNPPEFEPHWIRPIEPNYMNSNEDCLHLELSNYYQGLNDLACSRTIPFVCGKEAAIIA